VLTTFVEEFAIPTRAAALTLQERGDRIQAVLAAFDVDAQRVGSVAFQYGTSQRIEVDHGPPLLSQW